LITHRHQISPLDPDAASLRERCCEQDHHRWPLGWFVACRNRVALSCVAVGPDLLSCWTLLDATELIALAWPVSGIGVGWPVVRGGQRRSIRRQPTSGLCCNRDSRWFHGVIGLVPVSRRGILGC
jgi:hypothetical protein